MTTGRLSRRFVCLSMGVAAMSLGKSSKGAYLTKKPLASIEVIPHKYQRYDTAGDWKITDLPVQQGPAFSVTVSAMSDWRYELLVGLHEMVEAALCKQRGVSGADVDRFDKAFEAKRLPGNEDEPGDDPAAPYHREHVFATTLEKQMAAGLGVDWDAYNAEINSL